MSGGDTIVALASGQGRAGVAIIRISGPEAKGISEALSGGPCRPRVARLARVTSPSAGILDTALLLFFAGPASFTGEDVLELHVHGGPATIAAVLDCLIRELGCRFAEPGEFTRRAFANSKLDLTEAEGLADLVSAETEAQRVQALRQLEGSLSAVYQRWRQDLIGVLAFLEAQIDFPDEDIPDGVAGRVAALVAKLSTEMRNHLAEGAKGERVRDGVRVAIIGPPNAGKSSLLNHLVRRKAAIVSPIAGTTRDVVEARVSLGGVIVWLADTAGLREIDDEIESEGVRLALERAGEADIVIEVLDGSAPHALSAIALPKQPSVRLLNKSDLIDGDNIGESTGIATEGIETFTVSVRSGTGLEAFEDRLTQMVQGLTNISSGAPMTRLRHRLGVEQALEALNRVALAETDDPELLSEDLRLAARAIGRIVGSVDVDDILDRVFAEFCIGK